MPARASGHHLATESWPALLRLRPPRVVLFSLALFAGMLTCVAIAPGQARWPGMIASAIEWVMLALCAIAAGYAAGRLSGSGDPQDRAAAPFFLLMSVVLGLLLVHSAMVGTSIFDVGHTGLGDAAVTGALAGLALFGLLSYGRSIWAVRAARGYLLAGLVLLAVSRAGAGLLGDSPTGTGLGAIVIPAVGCLLATVVAFVANRRQRAPGELVTGLPWPSLLRVRHGHVLLCVAAVVVVMVAAVVAIDLVNVGGIAGDLPAPTWRRGFNHGAVEVAQWVTLALAIAAASAVAGRLAIGGAAGAASFYLVLSIGLGLMLVEDAGDVRHKLGSVGNEVFGGTILGQQQSLFTHAPVYGLLAFFMLYAVLRYGRYVWRVPAARRYLIAAYALYGLSQLGSFLSHVGDLYIRLGGAINRWVFSGALPPVPGADPRRSDYLIIDSLFEESFELLGAGCLLAMIVAFAAHRRTAALAEAAGTPTRRRPASSVAAYPTIRATVNQT